MIKAVALILTIAALAAATSVTINTHWQQIVRVSTTIPTFQIVVNPLTRRESPIAKQVYQNIKDLHTEMSRFAAWFPYPRLAVAELFPPNCSAATDKTSWNFDLIDPLVQDYLDSIEGHSGYLTMSTQPAWMFSTPKPVPVPDDPNQPDWAYPQGGKLNDPSVKQLADYYGRMASWYTKGQFTDECGQVHTSGKKTYHISGWEVFNEIEGEHRLSIEDYTRMYDAIVAEVKKVSPATKFIGMALGDPMHHEAYFNYFLNASNHLSGTPLDWISYHFYAVPAQKSKVETWGDQIFTQTEIFLNQVINIDAVRRQLSPLTKTTINEFGVILPGSGIQPKPDPVPDIYWNMCAAEYAYGFARLSQMGIDALGMSQMVGYPSQFPSVSMVDWNTGKGNPRYWTLRMIVEHLKPGNGRTISMVNTTATVGPVYAQSYIIEEGSLKQRKVLLVNKKSDQIQVIIPELTTGTLVYIDNTTPLYEPAVTKQVQGNTVSLGSYGVGIVVLVN